MTRRRERGLFVAIAVLAAVAFLPAIHGPWIFDDHQLIQGNRELHTLSAAGTWFTHEFWYGAGLANSLHYWRPLVSASYAVDWSLGGGHPAQFHVTNLLAHAAVALLLFAALRRWTANPSAAFAGALLWAVHPTKAENVAWISGRTDILCAAFVLVAAAGIARRLRGARLSGIALEVIGTACAYMSKELAVVLPMFAAVETWVAAGRPAIDRGLARRLARAALPQALVAIAYVAVRSIWLPIGGASSAPGLAAHARAVVETYGRFVALVLAPHRLSMQHALRGHDGSVAFSTLYDLIGAVALVGTVAALVMLRRRFAAGAIGIAMFVVALAPTLNILQSSQQTLVAERFLYLPTVGIALVVAALVAAAPASAQRRLWMLITAITLALIAQALSRAADFSDETSFWERELRLHPDSPAGLDYVISTPIDAFVGEQIAAAATLAPDQATFAADVLDIFVRSVSDRDPRVLRDLYASAGAVLARRSPSVRIEALGITVAIDTRGAFAEHLPQVAARIHAARAELAGRGGDPVTARAAALAEQAACGNCEHAAHTLALAEARGAALRSNVQSSDDLAQLQAHASELSRLGLWGAAYQAVQPHFEALTTTPADATRLAKLAFHAGQIVDAAAALAKAVPAEQIRGTLAGWAREFAWLPAATSAGGPSSP